MSLYKRWTDMVVDFVKTKGEKAFWEEYGKVETAIYKDLLLNHNEVKKASIKEIAAEYNTTPEFVMGFVDGINDSLRSTYDLEKVEEDEQLVFDVDLELLYFNMLDAKADYLYTLSQWEGIFSEEKRAEILKKYKDSKTVRNEKKIGRNDLCPCGSGKKYKQCCGRNA